jgi:hypothetical protein
MLMRNNLHRTGKSTHILAQYSIPELISPKNKSGPVPETRHRKSNSLPDTKSSQKERDRHSELSLLNPEPAEKNERRKSKRYRPLREG